MTQPLFFEADVEFAKVAAEVMLPDDPNQWSTEVLQEMYKQCPFSSDFEPHVVMDKVDGEKGFAFGHIELRNKTEIQHGADPSAVASAGIKNARIPIIIKDRKLQPLDLVVTDDSKVMPLTEARLRQAIFRPQAFDITGRGPGDMSMIGQLYPPYRQNYGFGGGGATMNVGMGKEGSALEQYLAAKPGEQKTAAPARAMPPVEVKTGSVLAGILSTIRETDYQSFFQKFSSDRGLQAQYVANGAATGESLQLLAEYEPAPVHKLAGALMHHLKPTVAQLRKEAEGYTLKTAAHNCWAPEEKHLDRGEAVRLLGHKVVLAADTSGAATMTLGEGAEETESPEADSAELINQFGIYKVQDEQGRHLIGFVFTNLIDLDGTALPISLFTNGSQMAVQGDIVGINVGGGASLFEGHPEGMGAFYHLLPNGRAEATIPMTINATMAAPEQGGVILHAETFDGREVQVIVQPNIEKVTPSPEGDHLLIPDSFSWLPLAKAEETHLCGDPSGFNKEAQAARAAASVQVRYGGADSFAVDGFAVDKLAGGERHFLSLNDTMFLLGGLGADLDYAQKKLGEAAAWGRPADVRVGHHIKTAAERMAEAQEKAASVVLSTPDLRVDLVKEAGVIPDPVAVDTVLSLGFLNPENLGAFVGYMPSIDEAQLRMCELLLASRLGLRDVPAPALEKAIRATEDTLEGLKILAFQRS